MIPKFKAWKKTNDPEMFEDIRAIDFEKNIIRIGYKLSEYTTRIDEENLDNVELLQSTRLFDKNGTEIFEGDILHHKVQGTGVVFYPYRDTMASFGIRNVNTNFGRNLQDTAKAGYEVIGNKFEHLHLLGEE